MKKQLAVAVTVALLTLPLSTSIVFAETTSTTATGTTATDTPATGTTTTGTTATDTTATGTTTTGTTATDTTTTGTTATDTVTGADGSEVTPSNWLTTLIAKIQIALSFDPVRKGELSERLALAKLAQAKKLMAEGKTEDSQIALGEYADKITKAQEFLELVKEPDSEQAKKLALALTNVNSNNINVLSNLLDKLPPQAAQKLALNVVRSMEKAVNKLEKQTAVAPVTPVETTETSTTTPTTTPTPTESTQVTTSVASEKSLEKQAKLALKDFKKSIEEKGNIHLDEVKQVTDENKDEDTDSEKIASDEVTPASQEPSSSQPTSVTVSPAQPQQDPTSIHSPVPSNNKVQVKPKSDKQENEKSHDKNDGDKKGSHERD